MTDMPSPVRREASAPGVQPDAPRDPLDELETFVADQIQSVEDSRDTYLRHANRCNQVAQGLRNSLAALRAQRAAAVTKV